MISLAHASLKSLVFFDTADSVGAPAPPSLALCELEIAS